MLSLALLIMNQAIVTATIASSNRPTLANRIGDYQHKSDRGARDPPEDRHHAHHYEKNGPVAGVGAKLRRTARPVKTSTTIPGPNTLPEPPLPIEKDVATMRANAPRGPSI